jgi:arsenite/tail-anchored protein-transporting ATPase
VRAAELGHRTLVVSTDIAHSLADILDTDVGADPQTVAPGLAAQEINVLEEARRSWGQVQDQFAEILRREGVSEVQAEELAIVPGMDEVAALVQIGRRARSGEYDCIVVDAAPTGETIRLLSMPDSFRWYATRIQEWRGRLMKLAGPFLRNALPDLNIVDAVDRLSTRVRELRGTLTDASATSYRIVVTPDRAVLKEAQRAETYLNLFEYPIDCVVVNRMLPSDADSAFLTALRDRQDRLRGEIDRAFPTLPRFQAPHLVEEPLGVPALSAFARELFSERDPTEVFHVGRTLEVERRGDEHVLRVPMPNVELDKLSLTKHGDELYVEVGNFRRGIALPAVLASLEPDVARVRDGALEVSFK